MSFTAGNINAMERQMKKAMGALLQAQPVDPYGGGAQVSVNLYVGTRRANESDVTAGAQADTGLIATIDADDWDAKIPHEPGKGDVIHWLGKRHAVDRSVASGPGGNKIFYKARLQG